MTPRDIILSVFILIGLTISQVFVFDFISFRGFGVPMVYPLFVFLLPIATPSAIVLLLAFAAGFVLDIATNSGGLHMASLVAVGFARKYALDIFRPLSGYDKLDTPGLKHQGFPWYAKYSLTLCFVHQMAYYFFERFSMNGFFYTSLRVLSGTVVSILVIWMLSLLFSPRASKRKR